MSISFYIWRDNVVTSLLALADREYQHLAWRGEIASSDGDPSEMLATLWHDFAFDSFASDNDGHLTTEQIDLQCAFRRHYCILPTPLKLARFGAQ